MTGVFCQGDIVTRGFCRGDFGTGGFCRGYFILEPSTRMSCNQTYYIECTGKHLHKNRLTELIQVSSTFLSFNPNFFHFFIYLIPDISHSRFLSNIQIFIIHRRSIIPLLSTGRHPKHCGRHRGGRLPISSKNFHNISPTFFRRAFRTVR